MHINHTTIAPRGRSFMALVAEIQLRVRPHRQAILYQT